ncbi:hypothetical protein FB567DRAFT_196713 [Paraphoma chrysanthemicola]|uniref:Uncharacterized protein n=1 Tax=Paraphoma chrysanthemicola TaxID=798071 RepID=A0A8K0QVT5_9PLEO|nr:hypothetical protein FB567DRAFT_196713 [Paraphoma chrysanthemicola]
MATIPFTYDRVDMISRRFFKLMSSEPDHDGPAEKKYFWYGEKTFPYRGPLGKIRRSIHSHKYDKWGFLLYRCDYSSDELWAKFLAALQKEVDDSLRCYDAEDLRSSLDMTPKEDKDLLDGATVERVRDIFTAWPGSDEAKAEFGGSTPRYMYCVHVDADVLDSVVNRAPKLLWSEARQVAYVNLVRPSTDWAPIPPDQLQYFTEEELNEDVDLVKVPLDYLGLDGYDELYDAEMFDFYREHPEV